MVFDVWPVYTCLRTAYPLGVACRDYPRDPSSSYAEPMVQRVFVVSNFEALTICATSRLTRRLDGFGA